MAGCEQQKRDVTSTPPQGGPVVQATSLIPGGTRPPPKDARGQYYEGNAYHVGEGSRLFRWYNCNGCHSNGGGGMGPPLIDPVWVYGSDIEQIYGSIVEGRPNGMPAWRSKLTDEQAWELAAYVRSLGGFSPAVSSSRRDAMTSVPPRNQVDSSGKRKGS
jgi:cytochrome c oxidase cbb3-type subunit 3